MRGGDRQAGEGAEPVPLARTVPAVRRLARPSPRERGERNPGAPRPWSLCAATPT